jgi:enolase
MSEINAVLARAILDSRGNPTVEVEVQTASGRSRRRPERRSTGEHEAFELRDGDKKRWLGKGVGKAVDNVNKTLGPSIIGMDALDQSAVDSRSARRRRNAQQGQDGRERHPGRVAWRWLARRPTPSESRLWRYLGGVQARVLPTPLMNILNGGVHADSGLEIQEFMIVPSGIATYEEALRAGTEVFHTLKKILKDKGLTVAVGDEGGFAPKLASNEEAHPGGRPAIEEAGYKPGKDVNIALDCAASEFFDKKTASTPSTRSPFRAKSSSESTRTFVASTRSSPSRTAARRTIGTAGSLLTDRIGSRSARRRRPLRHQRRAPARGIEAGRRTRSSSS